jgi:hypothetical protein
LEAWGILLYRVRITIKKKKLKTKKELKVFVNFLQKTNKQTNKQTNKHEKKRAQIQPVFNQRRFWRD